jgi:maleylpyruvate isomerase
MKLYGYWRSSATWRVRIALNYKGLTYDYQPVHLAHGGGEQHLAEYRTLNPMEQVPTLILDDHASERRLTQSLAIIEYLEEQFPHRPLLPRDPYLRARARQLAEIINSGIQPLQNLAVLQKVKHELGADDQAWARHFIAHGLPALERLAADVAGKFLVGDEPTIADLCLVPQLYNARRFQVDISGLALLARVEQACNQLAAFAAAHPDRQPDATPSK